MNATDTTIVQVRLKTTVYSNRIAYEEGPGSTADIVSDVSTPHYTDLGEMTLSSAKSMTSDDLWSMGVILEENSSDGFEEFSYWLEYLNSETGWQFVKTIH